MATQRHRTVLQIDVDDRKIRGLDRTLHRAFDDQMLVSFERVLDRTARTIDAMTKAAERFEAVMKRAGSGGGGPGGGGGGRRPPAGGGGGGDLGAAISALSRNIQQLNQAQAGGGGGGGGGGRGPGFAGRVASTALGSYLGGVGSSMSQEGFMAQAAGGIPVFGGFIRGAINSIHRYAGMYAQSQTQISRSAGTLGRTDAPGNFTRFGVARPEAAQQAAQFAQAAGRSGQGADASLMNTALAMQNFGGIREAPGVIRAAEVGGGRSSSNAMFEAVSAGIQTGIRETRLGQFVGVATQVLEQARLEGTNTQLASVLQTFAGFSGLGAGFQGEQGQRAGMQAMGAMRRFRPGADVASLVGLRAVGFGQPGGPSYHEALEMFQTDPARVMPQLLETIRNMAPGNEDAQIELMTQIAPRLMGFTPTVQQARSMVGGDTSVFQQRIGSGGGEQFIAGRQKRLAASFGVPSTEAAFRNRQIGVGQGTYRASRAMQTRELDVLARVLPAIAGGIEKMLEFFDMAMQAFQEGGFTGALQAIFGPVMDALVEGATPQPGSRAQQQLSGMSRLATDPVEVVKELVDGVVDVISGNTDTAAARPEREIRAGVRAGIERRRGLAPGTLGPTPEEAAASTRARAAEERMNLPEGALGSPEANAADALRRAQEALGEAAEHMSGVGLPSESQVAVG